MLKKGFKIASGELGGFVEKEISSQIQKDTKSLVKDIGQRIKKVESPIDDLLKEDSDIYNNYILAKSVKEISPVIAAYIILYDYVNSKLYKYYRVS